MKYREDIDNIINMYKAIEMKYKIHRIKRVSSVCNKNMVDLVINRCTWTITSLLRERRINESNHTIVSVPFK